MAVTRFSVLLILISLLVNIASSADSPAPAPHSSVKSSSPSPTPAPNSSPISSPPAPTPTPANSPHSDSPPAPSPENSPSPSPSPDEADDTGVSHTGIGDVDKKSSGGGTSAGKKAGIALGVIAAVGVVAVGAMVYKKRRQNIQRSEYGYTARRELL
ncbi:hypothetical protein L195_g035588 [Trifolium pratense]|uniref:Uncharacterized protein n=2 Tax=Trifolium pratense TaxID=57577 RepID=A0A2K3LM49_TRIPR|nr:early nodulin-20-like [Trifolium pratense]PNX79602.1 hypothetical protein L195_g035588 [Trifolium pratense]CAJ2654412.1 unnamed protein product [Trifolium pratense]